MLKGVPQIMDITSIKSILHYLSKEILPSKFEVAQQPEPNTIQLCFRGINNVSWIEVSWQGDCARIIKIARPAKTGSDSTLAKQLSHGLRYMALVSIKQAGYERVINFEFAKKPGEGISKNLIVELMGKHSNFFYLDRNYKIIAAGKQIKSNQSRFRTISTGSIYTKPPTNFKKTPDINESYEDWVENLSITPKQLKESLMDSYQGVSPILTSQIEFLSNLKTKNIMNLNITSIDKSDLKKIFHIWKIWINRFQNNDFYYSSFHNFFYCVWFSKEETLGEENFNLLERVCKYYDYFLKLKKIEIISERLVNIIHKQQNIQTRNLNTQSKLLENSENHEFYKIEADNIFLQEKLSKENVIEAQKLYKKSKKLKRAKNLIKDRIKIYQNKLNRLGEFNAMFENLNSLDIETNDIKVNLIEELIEEIYKEFDIKAKNSRNIKKRLKETKAAPKEIKTPGGLILQIGRNMRQNDLISFKSSKRGDLWFHAQESPGSHIVLKSSACIATEADIQIAADIAAFFCKAKENLKVPINLVKVKDLQKINSGGPGCVSFRNSEVIWGNPTRGKDYIKNNP